MTMKLAQALSWKILPWRKKALLTIQQAVHPNALGRHIQWQPSPEGEYQAVWGVRGRFYKVRFENSAGLVHVISLDGDNASVPGGWQPFDLVDPYLILLEGPRKC